MIRRDFIVKNRNTIETRSTHLERRLAAAEFKGEDLSNKSFLHFESPNDMKFMRGFYTLLRSKNILTQIKEKNLPEFVFTHSKRDTIEAHKNAKKDNINISTLVDMDWDVRNKMIKQSDGIHSTRYACTLLTLQFLKGDKELDLKYLYKVLKGIEVNLNNSQCSSIRETAIQRTWSRLVSGRPYARKHLMSNDVKQPLNDHSLAESIYMEIYDCKDGDFLDKNEIYRYEKKLRVTAIHDSNGKLQELLQGMLKDIIQ